MIDYDLPPDCQYSRHFGNCIHCSNKTIKEDESLATDESIEDIEKPYCVEHECFIEGDLDEEGCDSFDRDTDY